MMNFNVLLILVGKPYFLTFAVFSLMLSTVLWVGVRCLVIIMQVPECKE